MRIIFFVGTSSSGKTTIANKILKKSKKIHYLSSDIVYSILHDEYFKKHKSPEKRNIKIFKPWIMKNLYQRYATKIMEILDSKESKDSNDPKDHKDGVLLIDDIRFDVLDYLPNNIKKRIEIVLVYASLTQLQKNVESRKNTEPRKMSIILKQFMDFYEPCVRNKDREFENKNMFVTKKEILGLFNDNNNANESPKELMDHFFHNSSKNKVYICPKKTETFKIIIN